MSSSATSVAEITMPQMGVSVAEGTIVEWHKRVGDWVERDEVIVGGGSRDRKLLVPPAALTPLLSPWGGPRKSRSTG